MLGLDVGDASLGLLLSWTINAGIVGLALERQILDSRLDGGEV